MATSSSIVTFPVKITKTIVIEVTNQDDLDYMNDPQGFALDFAADMLESGSIVIEIDGVKLP